MICCMFTSVLCCSHNTGKSLSNRLYPTKTPCSMFTSNSQDSAWSWHVIFPEESMLSTIMGLATEDITQKELIWICKANSSFQPLTRCLMILPTANTRITISVWSLDIKYLHSDKQRLSGSKAWWGVFLHQGKGAETKLMDRLTGVQWRKVSVYFTVILSNVKAVSIYILTVERWHIYTALHK